MARAQKARPVASTNKNTGDMEALIANLETTIGEFRRGTSTQAVDITTACTEVAGCVTTTCEAGCQDFIAIEE